MPLRYTVTKLIEKHLQQKDELKGQANQGRQASSDYWLLHSSGTLHLTTCHVISAKWELQSIGILNQSLSIEHTQPQRGPG